MKISVISSRKSILAFLNVLRCIFYSHITQHHFHTSIFVKSYYKLKSALGMERVITMKLEFHSVYSDFFFNWQFFLN